MSEVRVASRYAKSLIDLSIEQNALEEVKKDMDLFIVILKENSQLQAILRNPIVSQDKKKNILHDLFATKVHKATLGFFDIMIAKGRGKVLYGAAQEFINQYNINKNILTAYVVSATVLTSDAEKQICAVVEKATGKHVTLNVKTDSTLIGGFTLTVGDKQFDASILKRLKVLRQNLNTNMYSANF